MIGVCGHTVNAAADDVVAHHPKRDRQQSDVCDHPSRRFDDERRRTVFPARAETLAIGACVSNAGERDVEEVEDAIAERRISLV